MSADKKQIWLNGQFIEVIEAVYAAYHLDPEQTAKDTCAYCNDRSGFDRVIIRRRK